MQNVESPGVSDGATEQRMDNLGLTAPRVTIAQIAGLIANETYYTHGVLTICVLELVNGFTVTGESACASPENFNEQIGRDLARAQAVNKVWPLEGYLLKQKLHEGAVERVAMRHTPEFIAEICHEANRALCKANGDDSQQPWKDAPDWQRASAINGVNFHISRPDATPENSHENWLSEKIADGWVYGAVKNPALKTHPCIRPYADLPLDQRAKDYVFRALVHALAQLD